MSPGGISLGHKPGCWGQQAPSGRSRAEPGSCCVSVMLNIPVAHAVLPLGFGHTRVCSVEGSHLFGVTLGMPLYDLQEL